MSHSAAPHAAVDDDVYEGLHIPKGEYYASSLHGLMSIDAFCRGCSHFEPVVSVVLFFQNKA